MSWSDFWVWYTNTTAENQKDILEQIQLDKFLQRLSPKYQIEVLDGAPKEVIKPVSHLLSYTVLRELKFDTMSKKDFSLVLK